MNLQMGLNKTVYLDGYNKIHNLGNCRNLMSMVWAYHEKRGYKFQEQKFLIIHPLEAGSKKNQS